MHDPLHFDDEHLTQLGLTLDFGPHDLEMNREGALSPDQIARLETDLRWTYWPAIIILALMVLFTGATSLQAGSFAAVPVVFLMVVAAIPAVLLHLERRNLPQQRVRATLLRIGGMSLIARRFGLTDDGEPRIKLPVEGGKTLFAPRHLYKVLNANRPYIVYYVAVRTWHGYRALSIEPDGGTGPAASSAAPKPKRKTRRGA